MACQIVLEANGFRIPATLNDTVAALNFKKRLPITVTGYRSPVDYCCTAAIGRYDPLETKSGWENGDISLAGGWFAVLFGGEEQSGEYHNMMIIAHIEEENLHLVKELTETVKFKVTLAA